MLAPHRSISGYARRSRLASAQNPLPQMYSYFGDTTLAWISTEHNSPNIFDFFRRRESLTGLCRSSVGGVAPATRESPRRGRTGQTPIRSAGVPGDEIPRGLLCR